MQSTPTSNHGSSTENIKTGLPFLNPTIITNDLPDSSSTTGSLPGTPFDPPQPSPPLLESSLPPVAQLSLSDDGPVEQELPVNSAANSATSESFEAKGVDDVARTTVPLSKENLAYSYPPPPSGDKANGSFPYPASTPHLTRAPVEILCKDPAYGRGVFAARDIQMGETVDISPVLVLGEEEYKGRAKGEASDGTLRGVEASQLRGYVFTWGRDGSMAVALGIGSLFNHSTSPNITYILQPEDYTISYRAAKRINAGDELFIFYGHNVSFANDTAEVVSEVESSDDGWGGLGGVASEAGSSECSEHTTEMKRLTVEELHERDNEVVEFTEESFPWQKISDIVDPEDEVLSTMPCWAITVEARYSATVFAFCRRHTSRKFNELAHLKRVKPVEGEAILRPRSKSPKSTNGSESDDSGNASDRSQRAPSIRTGPDALQRVLLFPATTAPANLLDLLADSPLAKQMGDQLPEPYIVDVPAKAAYTEEQADEWGKVWPVQVVHIREGAKATRRKRGWERARLEWIEKEARKCWEKAEEAAKRGEHAIACHVTDSWSSGFHTSLRRPLTLVNAFDTRKTTGNVLAHAACNAIDAIGVLDLHGGRPDKELFSPDAADPPYLLTGLTIFMSHEPCLLCAMSLLHSRIKQLFFIKTAPGAGGCGSLYNVHEDGGLNHRFEVWQWKGPEDKGMGGGAGVGLKCDP